MWFEWFAIAVDHERQARDARARQLDMGSANGAFGGLLRAERRASMVGVSAASHSIDALYGEVKPLVPISEHVLKRWSKNKMPRYGRIFETLKRGVRLGPRANEWPIRFEELYRSRDPLAHPDGVPHPGGLENLAQEPADYSLEAAQAAVDLAFEVLTTTISRPRPKIQDWAGGQTGLKLEAARLMRESRVQASEPRDKLSEVVPGLPVRFDRGARVRSPA